MKNRIQSGAGTNDGTFRIYAYTTALISLREDSNGASRAVLEKNDK